MQQNSPISSPFTNMVLLLTINGIKFTQREIDILACVLQGRSQKTVASLLSIAPRTVETHVRNIMLKLECNSSESIRVYIEQSGNSSILRQHYKALLIQANFEKQLQSLASLMREELLTCYLLWEEDQSDISPLIKKLVHDFHHLGIQPLIKVLKKENFVPPFAASKNALDKEIILCIGLKDSLRHLLDTYKDLTLYNDLFLLIFLTEEKEDLSKDFQEYEKIKYIYNHGNYYFSFLEIFKITFPEKGVENLILSFKEEYFSLENNYSSPSGVKEFSQTSETPPSQISKIGKENHNSQIYSLGANLLTIVSSILTIVVLVLGALTFKDPLTQDTTLNKRNSKFPARSETPIIHAELSVPKQSALLHRPLLINQINKALRVSEPIQTVALIGIGGAGKTTIARQYARQQNAQVIWEINAETPESLSHSFESLAYALSQTEEERRILREIQEIKNNQEREEKIILLVKNKLKIYSPWLLIYNNVEKFKDIQHHFPHDSKIWGEGRVLITSRNHHIQSNTQINHAFEISDLTTSEKLALFTKIMEEDGKSLSDIASPEETLKFLEQLPPFPLDISMAAHYLLVTNISYSQYLEHLTSYNADFYLLHQAVLKEVSDYDETRYRIISLTVKDLMDINPAFQELLLLISMLGSQNIPKKLLDSYENDTIADNFIYYLKKYSLINYDKVSPWKGSPSYSIHRSTQRIILAYLTTVLHIGNNHPYLQKIMQLLEAYSDETIDRYELKEMKALQHHLEKFLSHQQFLSPTVAGAIEGQLGHIYYKLGNYPVGKQLLKESLRKLLIDSIKNSKRIAPLMVTLSSAHWDLGECKEAKTHLEKTIQIYKNYLPDKKGELARAIGYLGVINSELENFIEAEELLQTALKLYQTYIPRYHKGIAQALAYLGIVYRVRGKYDEGIEVLKQSLNIYKTYLPHKHISFAWALKNLASIYSKTGNYKEALTAFQESVHIYEEYLPDNHTEIAIIYAQIGNINRALGNYKLAKTLIERSLDIYKKHLPKTHILLAQSLGHLAHISRELGNYTEAKLYHEQSISICSENLSHHSLKIAWAKMYLGNILARLGNFSEAHHALQSSLQVFEKNYGKNHLELARIGSYLGQFYLLKGDLEKAKIYLLNALKEFQKQSHTDAYIILEDLAQLYLEKFKKAEMNGNSLEAHNHKQQAVIYLKQALEITNRNLPEGNPMSQRIRNRLQCLT